MKLKRLEISGFKSFAQKTILDFDHGITAIVGPNGCGKSNIVDAMKWVMGEQGMKGVRGKKSEDLIFSGSKKKARLGKARVSLFMDNADGMSDIDFPEVIVSRNVFRNGDGEYILNNSKVRLKDISEILAKGRMSQKTFSIINQGMADAVLNYSPQERRLILEEAAGVREAQLKKDDAERKIKSTQNNLLKVSSIMTEIVPHLRYLRKQASKAQQRDNVLEKLKNLQKKYFYVNLRDLNGSKEDFSGKIKNIRDGIFEKSQNLIQLKKELEEKEKNMFGEDSATPKLQQDWSDLRLQISDLERTLARIEAKIEMASEERAPQVLPVDIEYIKTRVSDVIEFIKKSLSARDAARKNDLIKDGVKVLEKLNDEIKKGRVKKFEKKVEVPKDLLRKKDKLENQISALSEKADEVQATLVDIRERESKEKSKLFEIEREIRNTEDGIYRSKDGLRDLEIQEAKFSMQIEEIQRDIGDSGMSIKDVLASGEEFGENARLNKDDAEREIRRLKVKLDEIGGIDPATIKEYEETNTRYEFLEKESRDLQESMGGLVKIIKELDEKIRVTFNEYFSVINTEFNNYFRLIFGGGKASLLRKKNVRHAKGEEGEEISEEEGEIAKEGVDISVSLPGKKVKDLSMFSGGERSLTSMALLFAIIASASPPFLVLDEIDAALDEDNSRKFGNILEQLSGKTQFVLITHNRETMKLANTLYGVTMDDGMSRLLSLKLV